MDVYIKGTDNLSTTFQPDFLGGVTTIETNLLLRKDKKEAFYSSVEKPKWEAYSTQLVPYYAWSNRGLAEMTVIMPILWCSNF